MDTSIQISRCLSRVKLYEGREGKRVKWKSKAVDVQVVPRLGEMVDKGEQVQIDTSKHKGLIDYEVLAATANAPLRIQEDH